MHHALYPVCISIVISLLFVYPLRAQVAVRIPDVELRVLGISNIEGKLWLATSRGAYRVEGDTVTRISGIESRVYGISNINGQVWLGTDKGAYRAEGDKATRIPSIELRVYGISNIEGKLWLATNRGAYRVEGDKATRILGIEWRVSSISDIDGKVWLATIKGAYRVEGDTATRIPDRDLTIFDISNIDGKVWLATDKGVYRIDGDIPSRIIDRELMVLGISNIDGQVWLATREGAYRVDGDTATRISGIESWVNDISNIDGKVWLATSRGAYRVEGDTATRISDIDLGVYGISNIGGKVWLATLEGAYRVDGDTAKRVLDLRIYGISNIGGKVWLATIAGAYRVDDVRLLVEIIPDSWWGRAVSQFFPKVLTSGGHGVQVQYVREGDEEDPYPESFPRKFKVIATPVEDKFDEQLENQNFILPEQIHFTLDTGYPTIYINVCDQWGNCFEYRHSRLVVPAPIALGIALPSFWVLFLLLAFVFAPINTFSHNLLMNPWLRTYGSFGVIPLILTVFPPVRRHIMGRYIKSTRQADEFSQWKDRFVVPDATFLPEKFSCLLENKRKIFLVGHSGIGKTSFLKFLMACYSETGDNIQPFGKVVPVYISLARHKGENPESMFHSALEGYGGLFDRELTAWFLRQGGFVVLLDGLNEIDEAIRNKVNSFVDRHHKRNYFCLTSQETYPDFAWMEKIQVPALSNDCIESMLKKRLEPDKIEAAMSRFSRETYDIYRVPQDLEFAIELLKQNLALPQTRSELYEAILQPIFRTWEEMGRTDYPQLLCMHAYSMLSSNNPFFEDSNSPLPEELRNSLLDRKFVVRRGDKFHYQHDLIRAYLASRYFLPRWKELLAEDTVQIDSNWLSMLEFVLQELRSPEELKNLCFSLLEKKADLAGVLFRELERRNDALIRDWHDEFLQAYGSASLDRQ